MSKLLFITGVSGYLGAHVLQRALEDGYRVRGTARGAKVAKVQTEFAKYGDRVQIVDVGDIGSTDVREHLRGVDAIIHTAAPVPNSDIGLAMVDRAVDGALNIIRQGYELGIRKVIYTSSIGAMNHLTGFANDSWNDITEEQAKSNSVFFAYMYTKKVAELKLWEYADAHPDLDVTSISPTWVVGPPSDVQTFPTVDFNALSTGVIAWHLFDKERKNQFPIFGGHCDVRDVARAHIGALENPSHTTTGRKRIAFSAPFDLDWTNAVDLVARERPELKDRLVAKDAINKLDHYQLPTDLERTTLVTGISANGWTGWEKTVLDNVDSVIRVEKLWKDAGYKVELPTNLFASP